MATNEESQRPLPHEEGYGSPTAEDEMPQQDQRKIDEPAKMDESGKEDAARRATQEPSTDAPIEDDNSEEDSDRESFSSESDEDGSGLPD